MPDIPPFLGITRALQPFTTDDPAQMPEAESRRDDVLNDESLRERILAAIGFFPKPKERLSQFWERQMPGMMPPNWTGPRGRDLQLPSETRRALVKAMRKAEER